MTIAASLMILVSIFTDQWLIGSTSQLQGPFGHAEESMGLFGGNNMCQPMENMLFEGECVPDFERLKVELLKEEETLLPHAWKGGIGCMVVGLAIMVLTACFRHCCCCSVFTFSGSLQSFAAVLFSMGLVAYPAGWGSPEVVTMCQDSNSFVLGHCKIGGAYWMAVCGHCLHLLGLLPHRLRLQVHQEPQDHVQDAGRGEVYLRSITEDWWGG